jgi:hypothetical protein
MNTRVALLLTALLTVSQVYATAPGAASVSVAASQQSAGSAEAVAAFLIKKSADVRTDVSPEVKTACAAVLKAPKSLSPQTVQILEESFKELEQAGHINAEEHAALQPDLQVLRRATNISQYQVTGVNPTSQFASLIEGSVTASFDNSTNVQSIPQGIKDFLTLGTLSGAWNSVDDTLWPAAGNPSRAGDIGWGTVIGEAQPDGSIGAHGNLALHTITGETMPTNALRKNFSQNGTKNNSSDGKSYAGNLALGTIAYENLDADVQNRLNSGVVPATANSVVQRDSQGSVYAYNFYGNVVLPAGLGLTWLTTSQEADLYSLYVEHDAEVGGNTTLDGALGVSGVTRLYDDLYLYSADGSDVFVIQNDVGEEGVKTVFSVASGTGNTKISGTLDVNGVTTLNNNLNVNGNTLLEGTLDVYNNQTLHNGSTLTLNDGYDESAIITLGSSAGTMASIDESGNADFQGTLTVHDESYLKNDVTVHNSCHDHSSNLIVKSHSCEDCSALQTRDHDNDVTFRVKAETGDTTVHGYANMKKTLTVKNDSHDDLSSVIVESNSSEDYSGLIAQNAYSYETFKVRAETGDTTIHGSTRMKKNLTVSNSSEDDLSNVIIESNSCEDCSGFVTKNHDCEQTFKVRAEDGNTDIVGTLDVHSNQTLHDGSTLTLNNSYDDSAMITLGTDSGAMASIDESGNADFQGTLTVHDESSFKNNVTIHNHCEDDRSNLVIKSNSCEDNSSLQTKDHDCDVTFKVEAESGDTTIHGYSRLKKNLTVNNSCEDDLSNIITESNSCYDYSGFVAKNDDCEETFKVIAQSGNMTVKGTTRMKNNLKVSSPCEDDESFVTVESHSCEDSSGLVTKNHDCEQTFKVRAENGQTDIQGETTINNNLIVNGDCVSLIVQNDNGYYDSPVQVFNVDSNTGNTVVAGTLDVYNNQTLHNGSVLALNNGYDDSASITLGNDNGEMASIDENGNQYLHGELEVRGQSRFKNNLRVNSPCEDDQSNITIESNSCSDNSGFVAKNDDCEETFKVIAQNGNTAIAGTLTVAKDFKIKQGDACSVFKVCANSGNTTIDGQVTINDRLTVTGSGVDITGGGSIRGGVKLYGTPIVYEGMIFDDLQTSSPDGLYNLMVDAEGNLYRSNVVND